MRLFGFILRMEDWIRDSGVANMPPGSIYPNSRILSVVMNDRSEHSSAFYPAIQLGVLFHNVLSESIII